MIFLPWGLAGDPIVYCFLFQVYNNTVTTYLWQFSKIIEQFKGNRVEVAFELQTYFPVVASLPPKNIVIFRRERSNYWKYVCSSQARVEETQRDPRPGVGWDLGYF